MQITLVRVAPAIREVIQCEAEHFAAITHIGRCGDD